MARAVVAVWHVMCGRYAASRRPEDLAGLFEVEKWEPEETLEPDCNVAPTKEVYAVLDRPVKDAGRPSVRFASCATLKWGLVPSWAKTPEGGARMINARAETVHEKPSFRRAFAARRCILPADGYYEWVTGADERRAGGGGQEEAAAQAALLRDPRRRLGLRDGRAVRVLAGPDAARRPPAGLVGDLLGDHHRGRDRPRWPWPPPRARARSPTSTPGCR